MVGRALPQLLACYQATAAALQLQPAGVMLLHKYQGLG